MDFSTASAPSLYSSTHQYYPSPRQMKPAFDYLPHSPPVPAASLMPFPYTRHLDGFLQHKDWANVQDTVKDALFFCARALQEQHDEIIALQRQLIDIQRKEVSNIVPELERKVAAMTQAVQEAQNQNGDALVGMAALRTRMKENETAAERGLRELRRQVGEEAGVWHAVHVKASPNEGGTAPMTRVEGAGHMTPPASQEAHRRMDREAQLLDALSHKAGREEVDELRRRLEEVAFARDLASASAVASIKHARDMERGKEREELLLLKREVARLTHDLHTLTVEKMEGRKMNTEMAADKRSSQNDEEYVKLPLDAPSRLAGRWLWKSGARRMVTRRGGWVLWEKQATNPSFPLSLKAKVGSFEAQPFLWKPRESGVGVPLGGLYHLVVGLFTSRTVPLLQVYLNESLLFTISAPRRPIPIAVSICVFTPWGGAERQGGCGRGRVLRGSRAGGGLGQAYAGLLAISQVVKEDFQRTEGKRLTIK
ncbi:hypothetical protein Naga_100088g14 [Nannochloropsis gaditana]|uniref:Uncharacterized protein n=1 Tax=Nannochloropsis gaditana TaxID=72520 RepID=W7U6K7_9STRA|nr:hypothetical protein Naga_100088g14 [Nannochloropsis gaditana]